MVGKRQFPDDLMLQVYSVADFDRIDRTSRVIGVFDEFPDLRPLKVGPADPPRTKVTTMTDVMKGCPIADPVSHRPQHKTSIRRR
jgi:hypothetical protein